MYGKKKMMGKGKVKKYKDGGAITQQQEMAMGKTSKPSKSKGKKGNLVDVKHSTNKATDNKKNQEDFELMKRKMKGILIGSVVTIVLALAGTIAYKCFK